jgi:L,D-peptidoglycan transpeptidase YkuD (ErfK/YbiS/YcfS/YnhG family)
LHLARPGFSPTEGCIALELRDLLRVLAEGLMAIEVMG